MINWQLFYSFIKVGLFSFGGGYAALPFIHTEVVSTHHWLTEGEFNHLITISQLTPGPIAINAATFVGVKVNGEVGAVIATFGSVLPSCIIVTLLSLFYMKYRSLQTMKIVLATLRPAVIALIAVAGWSILQSAFSVKIATFDGKITFVSFILLFIASLFYLFKYQKRPILVMFVVGIVNVLLQFFLFH